jgi:monoamine oxidase
VNAPGTFITYAKGRRVDRSAGARRFWGNALDAAARADTPDWPPDSLRQYDTMTVADLWRSNGASDDDLAIARMGYLDLLGDGVDAISALNGLRETALRYPGDTHFRIEGGNDRLPNAFAARLRGQIRYGAAVVRIDHGPSSVRVAIKDASGVHEMSADRLICAVPFTTLRDVAIVPALSPSKARAIQEALSTSVTRTFLQCRTRFWAAEGLSGGAMTDLPIMSLGSATEGQPGPRAILEAYAGGANARTQAAMSIPNRLDFVIDQASRVFPALRSSVEGGTSVSWSDDPWARGAYAWFKPGQMTEFLPSTVRPEGRVHFAGDHTSALPGWMQGALASALRVVEEIRDA